MELVEAEYLAPRRVATSLREDSEAALRRPRDELVEVARPRRLVDDLVEPHVAVALARHVDHPRVVVVVGEEDACANEEEESELNWVKFRANYADVTN